MMTKSKGFAMLMHKIATIYGEKRGSEEMHTAFMNSSHSVKMVPTSETGGLMAYGENCESDIDKLLKKIDEKFATI